LSQQDLPPAATALSEIRAKLGSQSPAFFLDFDGTLAPIVLKPEDAEMPSETIEVLRLLSGRYPVCIVSGRPLDFLRARIDLPAIFYAAGHGHRIVGPPDSGVDFEVGPDDSGDLEAATYALGAALRNVAGALLEVKEVSVAVHYRRVAESDRPMVKEAVDEVLRDSSSLRLMEGKMVYELMPDISWGKGEAVKWLLNYLQPMMTEVFPICVGDDVTDEEMFAAVKGRGASLIVGEPDRPTQADYRLASPADVPGFLRMFAAPSAGAQKVVV